MKKKVLIGLALMAVMALLGPVGSAAAATHTVKLHYTVKPGPSNPTSGKFKGTPFGSGKLSQSETGVGAYNLTLKAKGGTVVLALKGGPKGAKIIGTWTALSGTGKYKGIKGKGKLVGSGVVFDLSGKVSY